MGVGGRGRGSGDTVVVGPVGLSDSLAVRR